MSEHRYLASGWCTCGHHRDDGHREGKQPDNRPTVATIRQTLQTHGPAYEPKAHR